MSRSRTSGRAFPTAWSRSSTVCSRLRPDDRFGSAVEVAEALEGMIRPVVSTDRGARTKAGGGKSPSVVSPAPPEPEAPPVDWSRIESSASGPGRPPLAKRLP